MMLLVIGMAALLVAVVMHIGPPRDGYRGRGHVPDEVRGG